MTAYRYRTTGQDHFAGARPSTDADRLQKFGPVHPMDAPISIGLRKRDWLLIVGLFAGLIFAMFPAASDATAPAPQHIASAFEASAGGKAPS